MTSAAFEECGIPEDGRLGEFWHVTKSHSYYWIVTGYMPMPEAWTLWLDPLGRRSVRVAGHCSCPPPVSPWIKWFTTDAKEVAPLKEKEEFERLASKGLVDESYKKKYHFADVEQGGTDAKAYVTLYHVDDLAGLRLITDVIKSLESKSERR
jgi:hypothetical protein